MAIAKKKNQALWNRIKSRIKAGSKGGRPGQWSARKAQLAVLAYKKAGGGYSGKKSSKNSLKKWTKQVAKVVDLDNGLLVKLSWLYWHIRKLEEYISSMYHK